MDEAEQLLRHVGVHLRGVHDRQLAGAQERCAASAAGPAAAHEDEETHDHRLVHALDAQQTHMQVAI